MVRIVLLGLLAASVPACGSKDAAPTAQPGAVAGKVLEVSGAVTVAGHPLAVGDPVKSDDAVETGADGSVVIELAHNQARWELGPNHKVKPTDSLAWTAAKKTDTAAQVDQATSAAGRPAERSAADTNSSAAKAPSPSAAIGPEPESAPRSAEAPSAKAAPPPAPPPPPPAAIAAPQAQPAPKDSPKAAPKAAPKASDDVVSGGAPGGGSVDRARAQPTPLLDSESSSSSPLQALNKCLAAGSSVHVKVHVANHVPAITFVDPVDAKVKQCITTAAKKLKLDNVTGDLELTITK